MPRDTDLVDTSVTKARSRRAILAGALAGAGALIARTVTFPDRLRAAGDDGANLVIAGTYADARGQTTLANMANANRVLWVASNADGLGAHGDGTAITGFSAKNDGVEGWAGGGGDGVFGHSSTGYGVVGQSNLGRGVAGFSDGNYGVMGITSSAISHAGVLGQGSVGPGIEGVSSQGTGALGYTGGAVPTRRTNTGVHGYAGTNSEGTGVFGEAPSGVGVRASTVNGYALRSSGRLRFDKVSGVARIAAGTTSKTISAGVNVSAGSFVLLTPRVNLGGRSLWYTTNASGDKFTIHLSAARSSATQVAWLLVG